MAAKKTLEAAVEYFAAHSHDAWRRQFHTANPKQRALPRMRMRGGKMVDINKPWKNLDAKAKADNRLAAYSAYAAIEKFPNDREKASDYVHKQWIKRNRRDPNQPKTLLQPYSALPEVEKDKDRAHVDRMKAALAAVRNQQKAPKKRTERALHIDQRAAARLEAAAARLSAACGRTISAEALLAAGVEAVLAVCETAAPAARQKNARAKTARAKSKTARARKKR